MDNAQLTELIEYYRDQGAPQDQQMLIALLREAQEQEGGTLSHAALEEIAEGCGVKSAVLHALIRRIPGLKSEAAPHTLEVCGTCRAGAKLREYIETAYRVKSGAVSEAGFVYRVTPCMKNCRHGPSIRWDGRLYSHADEAMIRSLAGEITDPASARRGRATCIR